MTYRMSRDNLISFIFAFKTLTNGKGTWNGKCAGGYHHPDKE